MTCPGARPAQGRYDGIGQGVTIAPQLPCRGRARQSDSRAISVVGESGSTIDPKREATANLCGEIDPRVERGAPQNQETGNVWVRMQAAPGQSMCRRAGVGAGPEPRPRLRKPTLALISFIRPLVNYNKTRCFYQPQCLRQAHLHFPWSLSCLPISKVRSCRQRFWRHLSIG